MSAAAGHLPGNWDPSSSEVSGSSSNKPSESQSSSAPMCGVGLMLLPLPSGEFKVKALVPNSPAAQCGILQV